jgi:hypothetical protein
MLAEILHIFWIWRSEITMDRPKDRGNIAKGSHCRFYVSGTDKIRRLLGFYIDFIQKNCKNGLKFKGE